MRQNEHKKRVSLLFNILPLYRKPVFTLINKSFECQWIFGNNLTNIPSCDAGNLNHAHELPLKRGIKNTYWLKGALKYLFGKESPDNIIMLGEIKFITTWLVIIRNKFRPRYRRKKIIFWAHGWYGNESRVQNLIYKYYFNMADRIMFYGNRAKKIAINNEIPSSKISVIHNSLDHDKFREIRQRLTIKSINIGTTLKGHFDNPSLPLVCYIGRLSPNKNLEMLLEAQKILSKQGININTIFIGDGPGRKSLEDLTEKYNLQDNVSYLGACYDEEKTAQYIYLSDACVSPGHIGLTAIHSLELGTPVITHNDFSHHAPEIESIEDNVNGWLFEYKNQDSLAAKILEAIKLCHDNRDAIRNLCIKSISDWTPEYQLRIIKENLN